MRELPMIVKPALLFVCLGNICRSPLAEAAFRAEADRLGLDWQIDSAGTGDWHLGHAPDPRAQAEALRHGIDISHYRARKVVPDDFRRFDHILALDHKNLADLQAMKPADATGRISLLLDHVPGGAGRSVADPFYADEVAFAVTWAEVAEAARHLAEEMATGA
jgi:protein-tyrosine phosphatase